MAAGYRYYVGDLLTGKIYRQVDLGNDRWSTSFDYGVAGTIEGSFPLRDVDPDTGEQTWPDARADAAPGKSYLVVSYVDDAGDETFIEGGPIWTSRYSDATGVLQIGAAGLSSYFDRRKALDIPAIEAGESPALTKLQLYTDNLRLSARDLVFAVTDGVEGGTIPVVLPDPGDLGPDPTLEPDTIETIYGYELSWVGAVLKSITDREDGPEIQFVPQRNAADPRFIEWAMLIGDPMLTQTGPPRQFDRTVQGADVRDIDISADGTGVAQRMWAAGQGEAEGRPIVYEDNDALIDLGWPLLEGEVASSDTVPDEGTLGQLAAESLAKSARPREAWTITISRDGRPNVGSIRPGEWASVRVRNHDYLPDGDHSMRMLAMSGSGDSGDVQIVAADRLDES
jgi:hypothetical protein